MSEIYKDGSLSAEIRAKNLQSQMALDEKIAQLVSIWARLREDGSFRYCFPENARGFWRSNKEWLKAEDILHHGLGQFTRPLGSYPTECREVISGLNNIQKYLVEETRLGIPLMSHEEGLAGLMGKGGTLFPNATNYGMSWNEALIESIGEAIRKEALSIGARQILAPVLDVSRDVRWGRTEETFSEDPYHTGLMALAYVKGIQGRDREVLATLKHYAGHSYSEGGRNHAPVHIGLRELYDIFLLPFEMVVKLGNAASVMPAYHDIDNEPATSSKRLLSDILRKSWGFDGLIVADYMAVSLLHTQHRVAQDEVEAAALALKAGLDVELPDPSCYVHLKEALKRGMVTLEDIDEAVFRMLLFKFRLGLFEQPYTAGSGDILGCRAHKKLSREAADQSIVLLRNEGILPLSSDKKVAITGPLASDSLAFFGGYHFPIHLIAQGINGTEQGAKTVLEAFKEKFMDLSYEKGCGILKERAINAAVFPGNSLAHQLRDDGLIFDKDDSGIAPACLIAKEADAVIVVVGDQTGLFQTGTVGEGSDTDSLALPGIQQQLVDSLLDTGVPIILVMLSGRPYYLGRAFKEAAAIIWAGFPGEEGAASIADIVMGKVNPSAKTSLSFSHSAGAQPFFYNDKVKSPGMPAAFHYGAIYPFGHGLSYTYFSYRECVISSEAPMDGEIEVSCIITNEGKRFGTEIVQLYVQDLYATVVRPERELKGFARIDLESRESKRVVFKIPVDVLSFTDMDFNRVLEPGDIRVMIGSSSMDIHYEGLVSLKGKKRYLGKRWRMVTRVEIH